MHSTANPPPSRGAHPYAAAYDPSTLSGPSKRPSSAGTHAMHALPPPSTPSATRVGPLAPPPMSDLPPPPNGFHGQPRYTALSAHPMYAADKQQRPSTSPSAILLSDPSSSDSRLRGQSSPVLSRHASRDPFDNIAFDAAGRQLVLRRQSTGPGGTGGGTVSRRIVIGEDGQEREETREERRARKERERAERAAMVAVGGEQGSPTSTTSRRSRTGRPGSSRLSDGVEFTSSLGSPPLPSAALAPIASTSTSTSTSTSSKSVLTIALQRAQSAVLLDSANNFPAAIAAYSQSVRLLKEVMARVDEGRGRESERKRNSGGGVIGRREGETTEEWERRQLKWERKEKAKVDEARRLKVIHDTYEDRIRMLITMNPSLALTQTVPFPSTSASTLPQTPSDPTSPPSFSPTSPSRPSSVASSTAGPTSTQTQQPSVQSHSRRSSTEQHNSSQVFAHRQGQRSISSLHTITTPPATLDSPASVSTPSFSFSFDPPRASEDSASSVDSARAAAEGIGSAMLLSNLISPPASPLEQEGEPTSGRGLPRIDHLPVFSSEAANEGYEVGAGEGEGERTLLAEGGSGEAETFLALAGADDAAGPSRRPSSFASDSTASGSALTPRPPQLFQPTHSPLLHPSTAAQSAPSIPAVQDPYASGNSESEADGEGEPPVTALDYPDDWPAVSPIISTSTLPSTSSAFPPPRAYDAEQQGEDEDEAEEEEELVAPLESLSLSSSADTRRPSIASLSMRRGSSASVVTRSSTVSGGAFANSQIGEGMRRTLSGGAEPTFGGGLEIRPRPNRSASLASSALMAPSLSASSVASTSSTASTSARPGYPLVNASTAAGTISQRRGLRSPQNSVVLEPPEAMIVVRAPSSERDRASEFGAMLPGAPKGGPATASTVPSSGGAFGSLPGRLRALSQPNSKRPKLQASWSEAPVPSSGPPIPPLLSDIALQSGRSVSSGHMPSLSTSSTATTNGRKASVPTPTSLNAPPFPSLLRSNSSSSIGSTGSSYATRYSDRASSPFGLPIANTAGMLQSGVETPIATAFPSRSSVQTASATGLATAAVPNGVYLSAGLPSPPTTTAPSSRETTLSITPVRRPFHLMRLVLATMPASPTTARASINSATAGAGGGGGAYLSEKLFVPSQIWTTQGGAKLVAIETKVRMLDLLSSGLDSVDKAGRMLLSAALASSSGERWARDEAARFGKELESFEGLAEGIQSTLAKKLGNVLIPAVGGGIAGGAGGKEKEDRGATGAPTGRKGSTAGFAAWSAKLGRSLDRVTNGVSLDSQATYVETISKVFKQAQCIDHHLALLLSVPTASSSTYSDATPFPSPDSSAYDLLPTPDKHRLERHLRRASEFFGQVVCRFVMRDVGVLLDKYVKRGGAWLSGE
ncbi:hypothetical protein JCM21900_003818 [Sporobolomyces salmonicolor]